MFKTGILRLEKGMWQGVAVPGNLREDPFRPLPLRRDLLHLVSRSLPSLPPITSVPVFNDKAVSHFLRMMARPLHESDECRVFVEYDAWRHVVMR